MFDNFLQSFTWSNLFLFEVKNFSFKPHLCSLKIWMEVFDLKSAFQLKKSTLFFRLFF